MDRVKYKPIEIAINVVTNKHLYNIFDEMGSTDEIVLFLFGRMESCVLK